MLLEHFKKTYNYIEDIPQISNKKNSIPKSRARCKTN